MTAVTIDERLDAMESRLDATNARVIEVLERLDELADRLEHALSDMLNAAYRQGVTDAVKHRTGYDPAIQ
jgi:hypothetical protein